MEFQKITNFLGKTSDDKDLPIFVIKRWIEVYDQSGGNYKANKEIRIKASMLISALCDYSDAYIVVKGDIIVTKKLFTTADFERTQNTNFNTINSNNANNTAFGEKEIGF